jgi:hypothetical protein
MADDGLLIAAILPYLEVIRNDDSANQKKAL